MIKLKVGNYVVATKYVDGDPGDHFCNPRALVNGLILAVAFWGPVAYLVWSYIR